MPQIPFQTVDWQAISPTLHAGTTGSATWRTLEFAGLRVRWVEYEPGYLANHWCKKGHIVHCLEGRLESELETGERFTLTAGMSYIVSDELSSHRSSTSTGAKLLIIDGDFLANPK